ncbi:hypothetical protein D9M72_509790 [compost metagenome]
MFFGGIVGMSFKAEFEILRLSGGLEYAIDKVFQMLYGKKGRRAAAEVYLFDHRLLLHFMAIELPFF